MGCICNCLVGIVNCILMSFSLSLLVSGIYLQINGRSDCEKVLTMPLIVLGGLLLAISIIGVMGTSCGSSTCMYIYLTLMFFLIIGVIGFTIFVFVITNRTVGEMFSNAEKMEKPESAWDLPNWLPNKVNNPENWNKIKSCLVDTKVCTTNEYKVDVTFNIMVFFNVHFPDLKLYNKSLPELQAACCMPPSHCGFIRMNGTFYEKPMLGPTEGSKDGDCNEWNNELSRLCFDCNTCKEGVVLNIKREWKALAFLNICVITFLLLIYMLGCCAFCF